MLTLWLILTASMVTAKCLPVSTHSDTGQGHPRSPAQVSEDILKQFNMTRQDIEVAKGRVVATRTPDNAALRLIRERAQNNRKQEIQQRVLDFVKLHGRLPLAIDSSMVQKGEKVAEIFNNSGVLGIVNTGKFRYLLPSCEVPKHVDEDLWTSNGSMHLYFNVGHIQPRDGYTLSITSAKLRLYKYPEGELQKSENCPQAADSSARLSEMSDEEKIRVSVHNYTKPLRKHRNHKRKLLDSQMAFVKEEFLMELDVRLAVRGWLSGGRNLGLVVEVEDTEGQRISSSTFFRSRDCSAAEGEANDEVSDPATTTSPLLELGIMEIPEGRNLEQILASLPSTSDSRYQQNVEAADSSLTVEESVPQRRQRHHNHHHSQSHNDEQADDASRAQHASSRHQQVKHSKHGHVIHPASHLFSRPVPFPTLATLEDHDLMGPSEDEEPEEVKEPAKEKRQHVMESLPIISHDSFMQRILESQLRLSPPSQRDSRRI